MNADLELVLPDIDKLLSGGIGCCQERDCGDWCPWYRIKVIDSWADSGSYPVEMNISVSACGIVAAAIREVAKRKREENSLIK
jgi:hypothetical protein